MERRTFLKFLSFNAIAIPIFGKIVKLLVIPTIKKPKLIFVGGLNAKDFNDGSARNPVATLNRGIELTGPGGTILVCPSHREDISGIIMVDKPNISIIPN